MVGCQTKGGSHHECLTISPEFDRGLYPTCADKCAPEIDQGKDLLRRLASLENRPKNSSAKSRPPPLPATDRSPPQKGTDPSNVWGIFRAKRVAPVGNQVGPFKKRKEATLRNGKQKSEKQKE